MRRTVMGVLALLMFTPALWALDSLKEKPKPAEQYDALVKEYEKAQTEFFKLYQAAKTDEERQKLFTEKYPKPQAYAVRFLELAEKNPKDPVAVKALVWVVTNARFGAETDKALDILFKDHFDSKELGQVCQSLVYSISPQTEKRLRTVLEKSPHREVQGQACYSLALYLRNRFQQDAEKQKEAEKLLDQVIEKYADLKHYRGTLGDAAKGQLFEIRNLAIGKVAPVIEGEDIDGKKFKLSDYRGKVVVLDFWGNW